MKLIIEISPLTQQYITKGYRTADVAEELFEATKNGIIINECKVEDCINRKNLAETMFELIDAYDSGEIPETSLNMYVQTHIKQLPPVYPKSEIKVEDIGRYDSYTDKFIKE